MKSIKKRLIKSFSLLICATIIILDILLISFVKKYYYDNSEALLRNQIQVATNLYNKYFSLSSLEENIYDNLDAFWDQTDGQVQIYDKDGNLMMDSIGASQDGMKYNDVQKALKGEKSSRWVGRVDYYDYKVMALSNPIKVNGKIIGAIRLQISLKSVDKGINTIVIFCIIISVLVLIFATIVSIVLSNGIINPIKKLTIVAEKMAGGDLSERSNSKAKDEIGKLANTLDYMAEELQKRNKLKDEFISSVSHELRTPLTAIKGWVITLNDDQTDRDTLKMGLNIIEKETDRLVTMVEELLDFSRMVNGKMALKQVDVEVETIVDFIKVYMASRAKRENKTLNISTDVKNTIINIDIDRIKQVLINLMDNSFKFTKDEGKIEVSIIEEEENIKFIVEDDGVGISKEDLPRVKEKFYKGKNVKSQNGIGLSICDEIVKLHGGEFTIESEENIGTKITIYIPIHRGGIGK